MAVMAVARAPSSSVGCGARGRVDVEVGVRKGPLLVAPILLLRIRAQREWFGALGMVAEVERPER